MKEAVRPYRMRTRAASSEATHRAILDAATRLFVAHDLHEVTLEEIAKGAGVTLQTVLRRFGSKDALFAAAARQHEETIFSSRAVPAQAVGDVAEAVRVLVASYESMGELGWRLLRYEHQHAACHDVLVRARAGHLAWLERTFGDRLPEPKDARARRLDALFTVTDFYVWKLHRLDLGASRAKVETLMAALVRTVLLAAEKP